MLRRMLVKHFMIPFKEIKSFISSLFVLDANIRFLYPSVSFFCTFRLHQHPFVCIISALLCFVTEKGMLVFISNILNIVK